MSQATAAIANMSRTLFRAAVNSIAQAIQSMNSGATQPGERYPYMLWADSTSGWAKQRNAGETAWIKRWPLGTGARVDLASAATLDLDADAANSEYLRVTGTTTTTAITLAEGQRRILLAAGAWPLTHGASLILPGAASYTCAAGDLLIVIGEAAGVVRVDIRKADGTAVVAPSSGFVTGMGMDWFLAAAPSGWIFAAGTIGDASSSASNRAHADCQSLYVALWTDYADAEAPVSGGRGISALADWAAHKTIGVPDARGRVTAGRDTMVSAASRLTTAGSGVDGATLGASGGVQNVTLSAAESGLPPHEHSLTWAKSLSGAGTTQNFLDPNATTVPMTATEGGFSVVPNATTVLTPAIAKASAVAAAAASSAHTNTQPTLVCNKIIKL